VAPAFLRDRRQGVTIRLWRRRPPPQAHLQVVVDASPWGIGGFRTERCASLLVCRRITHTDLMRFEAKLGDSYFNTVWEALAILVALRLWRAPGHHDCTCVLRSHNMSRCCGTRLYVTLCTHRRLIPSLRPSSAYRASFRPGVLLHLQSCSRCLRAPAQDLPGHRDLRGICRFGTNSRQQDAPALRSVGASVCKPADLVVMDRRGAQARCSDCSS